MSTQSLLPCVSLRVGLVEKACDLGEFFEIKRQAVVALAYVVRGGNAGKVCQGYRIVLTLRPRGEPVNFRSEGAASPSFPVARSSSYHPGWCRACMLMAK